MGALTSTCVRDCVRSSHEYAAEDLLHVSSEGTAPGSSGSRAPGVAPLVPKVGGLRPGSSGGAASTSVPPVPNFFQVLRDGKEARSQQTETPRFDEVRSSPRQPGEHETPRDNVGGEFRTPSATPRDPQESPRPAAEGGKVEEVSYEGMYLGTMKHGRGKLRMTNASYEGEFQNDGKHGTGVMTWDDGRQYRGGFVSNMFHGQATMTWPDGRKYIGIYADDRKHGEGTFSWQDGRRYQGQWINGKRHGVGVYTNAKGLTRRGMWQMDRPMHWEAAESPAEGATPTPRDPARLSVAVARAAQRVGRRVPLSSPREAEEVEVDLEIKATNI